ncbi:hypothetical protein MMC31_001926 [Peltigera leucophlebia]|nr:hypothetical protein [Peltigera leucophlebia]
MSALSKLVPLLVLFVLLGFFAFIGYAIYTIANDVADKTAKKMEKKHLNFTKDGLVVGVKERREEAYVDRTQSFLVKAWNFSTWPAYKSRYWNKDTPQQHQASHELQPRQTSQARIPQGSQPRAP